MSGFKTALVFRKVVVFKKKRASRSILELEKRYTHVNRSDFGQNSNGHDTSPLGGTVSQIGPGFAFFTEGT